MVSNAPVRVLIVDDSATARALLWSIMRRDPMIQVVGEARDANEARRLIKALSPDVVTLDVEMPRMDGLTFLEKLMYSRPMPVIVISSRVKPESNVTIRALSLGAVDCIDAAVMRDQTLASQTICRAVKSAATAKVSALGARSSKLQSRMSYEPSDRIVLIGASAGGVDAIFTLMDVYPENAPPTVIAQHMPERFLAGFAAGLDARFSPKVQLAEPMAQLVRGHVQICPGGAVHTLLRSGDEPPRLISEADEGCSEYVPSIDRLFHSAVPLAQRVVAVLLTGMGRDGAQGLLALREAGATTIAQTSESSVIDGMPRAARSIGAAGEVLPLADIGKRILELTSA